MNSLSYFLSNSRYTKLIIWLTLYALFSLAGQYGCMIPVDLTWLLGKGWWIPLGTITVVPLVDVSRSFTQHCTEQAGVSFKHSFLLMMGFPFFIALICTVQAGLPINICLATFGAINVGGLFDILTFKFVRRVSEKPYVRMVFSNLAATLSGGAVFYSVAYTNALPIVAGWLGLTFVNDYLMSDLVKAWVSQSLFIWVSGITMATVIGKVIESIERKESVKMALNV